MMRGGVAHTRPGEPVTRTLSGSFEGLMLDLLPVSAEAAAELFVIETVGRGHAGRPAGPLASVGGA